MQVTKNKADGIEIREPKVLEYALKPIQNEVTKSFAALPEAARHFFPVQAVRNAVTQ